ncbi:pyridoxamine 5'-phosphate oxidase family protein [Isosphaeraceae bacterium EP7]
MSWRIELDDAIRQAGDDPVSRYLHLATVRPDGRPANRTLVFRGFAPGSDALLVATDSRSSKLRQLPWGEVCWLFAGTRQQFRILGKLTAVGPGRDEEFAAERVRLWRAQSPAARIQYAWPEPGGHRADPSAFELPAPDADRPPAVFTLLILDPEEVDHLDLRPTPHRRTRWVRAGHGEWAPEPLNP